MIRICLSVVFVISFFNAFAQNDEEAIKFLLEKESATWRAGDVKTHADCWYIQPYSRILISTGDSGVIDLAPSVMVNPPLDIIGKGGSSVNSNYKMSIAGNYAWVSHDELSISAEGVKKYSSEFRMLEKINGQWKLVAQSIHINK